MDSLSGMLYATVEYLVSTQYYCEYLKSPAKVSSFPFLLPGAAECEDSNNGTEYELRHVTFLVIRVSVFLQ